jgi:hypothetical protein
MLNKFKKNNRKYMLPRKGYNYLKGLKKGIPKLRCANWARKGI